MHPPWRASFDPSGYSGVNIKIGYTSTFPQLDLPIPQVSYDLNQPMFNEATQIKILDYVDYYQSLNHDAQLKEQQWFTSKMMTLLVFQTGTMTLSGIHERLMNPLWTSFVTYVKDNQEQLFFGKDIIIVDY
jgi:hypothetical protein